MMAQGAAFETVDVLGVNVAHISTQELTQILMENAYGHRRDNPFFLTYLNAACSNLSTEDPDYNKILNNADCVYADGQSILWASRFFGKRLPERINAGDFINTFLRKAADCKVRLGLIGGRNGVAEHAAAEWVRLVPDLHIVFISDGYLTDDQTTAQAIAAADVDILLVGMGAPYQEKWAWLNKPLLKVKVIWCVGALFEYFGEGRRRAPHWMRRSGLEWTYRLMLEPRRLWRRYLIGNPRFVMRVLFQKLMLSSSK